MAISRILSWMIIYLNSLSRTAGEPCPAVIDRRYSSPGATIPEDLNGPAVLPQFCLAPHGVFRATRITPRAVSSYLAFSPLPVPAWEAGSFPYNCSCQRTGGVFSVTLSVNARLRERRPRILRGMLPYGVRTFLQRTASDSPAIICHLLVIYHNKAGNQDEIRQPERLPYNQNGDAAAIKKIVIIANAMISLAIIAPMFPSRLPHPARPASIIRLPAMISPATAPITGPT